VRVLMSLSVKSSLEPVLYLLFESNLYRVTIALLPHFPLLNCAVNRD
jgi:hypothetical protein